MSVNEFVKKRFGRFMDQCTNAEIYAALCEYVKDAAAKAELSAEEAGKKKLYEGDDVSFRKDQR